MCELIMILMTQHTELKKEKVGTIPLSSIIDTTSYVFAQHFTSMIINEIVILALCIWRFLSTTQSQSFSALYYSGSK